MGLDMYLTKKIYIGANYEHNKVNAKIEITVDSKPLKINVGKVTYISEAAMYWRKANHIHNWFVQNCQDGEDNCQESNVSKEQLKELLKTCKEVLADRSKAEELLPTGAGFFFGSTDYDEYYFGDIQETIEAIEPLIAEMEENYNIEAVYQASW